VTPLAEKSPSKSEKNDIFGSERQLDQSKLATEKKNENNDKEIIQSITFI
jgi:hypothetical protein